LGRSLQLFLDGSDRRTGELATRDALHEGHVVKRLSSTTLSTTT